MSPSPAPLAPGGAAAAFVLPVGLVLPTTNERSEIKWLAGEATRGPYKVAPSGHVYTGRDTPPLHVVWLLKDNCRYIASLPPEKVLGLLAYVEYLEAALDAATARAEATEADLQHYNKCLAHGATIGSQFTHAEVANKVRMLCRNDLDHEMVVVMARDRIIVLAAEVARLEKLAAAPSPSRGDGKEVANG